MSYWKGLRFGMMLQLAIGPVCLFILKTSIRNGLTDALLSVIAVTIVDSIYVLLALKGTTAFLHKKNVQMLLKIFGSIVLVLFGLDSVLGNWKIGLLPSMRIAVYNGDSSFIYAFLLTASNPLTIIFWAGVFSAEVLKEKMNKDEIRHFAFGCISSTLLFLGLVSILGALFQKYMPDDVIKVLNLAVGIVIIYFGVKLLISKDKKEKEGHAEGRNVD